MNCPAPRTTSKRGSQKVPLAKLITVILVTSIALVLFFGWYYLKGENPVELLSSNVSIARPSPEYLYTLYGTSEKRFRNPSATAVNDQKIYVADSLNRRIVVFNYNGKYLAQFGSTGPGKLKFPFGLVFADNEIFVTDIGTKKVHVFNLEGKFLRYFGENLVRIPSAIFYRGGKVYILDAALTKVAVFDKAGKKLISFGKRGGGEGELYFPFSIYVTELGEIYVADSNNNRIQVFNQQGNLLKILSGKNTNGEGGYAIPRGLAFDKAGNLYTTELLGAGVAITDKQGQVFLRSSAAGPSENGVEDTIKYPTAVFIDDNQRLYVTEFGNSRILVYKLK